MTEQLGKIDDYVLRCYSQEIKSALNKLDAIIKIFEAGNPLFLVDIESICNSLLNISSQLKETPALLGEIIARDPTLSREAIAKNPALFYPRLLSTIQCIHEICRRIQDLTTMKGLKFQSMGQALWMKSDMQEEIKKNLVDIRNSISRIQLHYL